MNNSNELRDLTLPHEMLLYDYPSPSAPAGRYAATIGFFDGVHQGHRHLLRQLRGVAASRGLRSMVVTFDRHPRQVVLPGWEPQLLTTLDEKKLLLSQTGVDALVTLRFDASMSGLSSRQFMADVLRRHLGVALLLTGYDNRFGHDRSSTFADYQRYGRESGMEVVAATPLSCGAETFSSSLARRLLAGGDVALAAECLGRCYALTGTVVHGERNGHAIGFPTANLQPDDRQKIIPARGAYAVRAVLADGTCHNAMTNIGLRPTFGGQEATIETHIFGLQGDIYGQRLTLSFVERLRDEQTFTSPDELAAQLARDRQAAERILA